MVGQERARWSQIASVIPAVEIFCLCIGVRGSGSATRDFLFSNCTPTSRAHFEIDLNKQFKLGQKQHFRWELTCPHVEAFFQRVE